MRIDRYTRVLRALEAEGTGRVCPGGLVRARVDVEVLEYFGRNVSAETGTAAELSAYAQSLLRVCGREVQLSGRGSEDQKLRAGVDESAQAAEVRVRWRGGDGGCDGEGE